jgi:hypothetical protein
MELPEAGPLGKPIRGNESERLFFIFKAALYKKLQQLEKPS